MLDDPWLSVRGGFGPQEMNPSLPKVLPVSPNISCQFSPTISIHVNHTFACSVQQYYAITVKHPALICSSNPPPKPCYAVLRFVSEIHPFLFIDFAHFQICVCFCASQSSCMLLYTATAPPCTQHKHCAQNTVAQTSHTLLNGTFSHLKLTHCSTPSKTLLVTCGHKK